MPRKLRIALRGAAIAAATGALYALYLVGLVPTGAIPRARRAWRSAILRAWGRLVCAAAGVRLDRVGRAPAPPCMVVSNHLGYLDIPVLASQLGAVFVANSEIARWPVWGPLSRSMGTLFVDRGRKRDIPRVNTRIERALRRGERIVLFPEGGTAGGERVGPFRPALLAPAADGGHPVHFASLSYATAPADPPAALAVCWWGGVPFAKHALGLLALERIEARLHFGERTLAERDRKRLAEALWRAVSHQFVPVSRAPAPPREEGAEPCAP
ncbi:MAG TPA: lysophospholipid acyltransferase family protein [Planctomycetota bacterium]|nr:lysophospholipid acyltransferase family protein [Planctomycetota bacterium]